MGAGSLILCGMLLFHPGPQARAAAIAPIAPASVPQTVIPAGPGSFAAGLFAQPRIAEQTLPAPFFSAGPGMTQKAVNVELNAAAAPRAGGLEASAVSASPVPAVVLEPAGVDASAALTPELIREVGIRSANLGVSQVSKDWEPRQKLHVERIRRIVDAALKDEALLARFVPVSDDWDRVTEHIPALVGDIAAKEGMELSEQELQEISNDFDMSDFRTDGIYIVGGDNENLYRSMTRYAEGYFASKRGIAALQRARQGLVKYFPDFYRDLPYRIFVMEAAQDGGSASYFGKTPEGYHWFNFFCPGLQKDGQTYGLFAKTYLFDHDVIDTLIMLHEYAHGLYAEMTGLLRSEGQVGAYYDTADAAFNEGFAVFMELMAGARLEQDAALWGWGERQKADLREWRRQRSQWLHQVFQKSRRGEAVKSMAYVEGTFKLLHKAFKKGGLEAVQNLLRSLDVKKTLAVRRDSPEYRAALKEPGDLNLFLK